MPDAAPPRWILGFLAILNESNGQLGGLLITNQWGRPLEFRVSTAVQPNRVQQILYGASLLPYICADLIGKTLLEKSSTRPNVVITDTAAALDLRLSLEAPVFWHCTGDCGADFPVCGQAGRPAPHSVAENLYCHARFRQDADVAKSLLNSQGVDLAEPFLRIREAVSEARKMGATSRG